MYATEEDIVDLYGSDELLITFDRDNDGVSDPIVVAKALQRATSEIDVYLAGRYDLPLLSVPEILTPLCVDIALYKGCANSMLVTDEKRKRYEDAISLLKKIAAGTASLGLKKEEEPASQDCAQVSAPPQIFSQNSLENF